MLFTKVENDCLLDEELAALQQLLSENEEITGLGEISAVMVPKWKPLTRRQYETAAQNWPTNFHEDKRYWMDF